MGGEGNRSVVCCALVSMLPSCVKRLVALWLALAAYAVITVTVTGKQIGGLASRIADADGVPRVLRVVEPS